MGNAKSKNPNTQGSKVYRDSVIGQISGEGEGCVFTSADNSRVESTVDDVAKDFAGPSYTPDAKGDATMPKFESGKRHSFEHSNCPSSEVVGQTSSGLPVVGKTDPVADKNKKVY